MATDNVDYGVQKGSGRFRLPSRLAKTIYSANGPILKSFTTAARNTLAASLTSADEGLMVYDTTLNRAILWTNASGATSASWKNPDGTTIA